MKLLCISRKYPPSVGGMQRMNYEVIRRLAAATNAIVIKWGGSQLYLLFFIYWALIRSLLLLPKRKRPDVIYLGDALLSPLGFTLKKILRRPVAVTAHGRDLTFRFPLYRRKIGFSLRRLDLVIGVSRHTTELCRAMGVPPERCVTINNGVNPEEHVPTPEDISAAREWLTARGIEPGIPIIMTVGRLVKRKGIARFISEIFPLLTASFPKLLYIVVGEGKERKSIEKAITEHRFGGNVILAGRLPNHLVRGLMGVSKVFVMPNIAVPGDVEGFGIAALEASCAGLPVIASDLEGIRDAVTDGENGFLIPPGNPRRFAAAIEMLLTNERKRQEAGERARKFTAEHYSWDKVAKNYLVKLENITKTRNTKP
ncbi:MAG: glycosyltransferase family 4 protein [Candidatus Aureabacteria bacterium]|nr:glycosyltransferase family 4 protein [Candidatus Auribacterota bacterium]